MKRISFLLGLLLVVLAFLWGYRSSSVLKGGDHTEAAPGKQVAEPSVNASPSDTSQPDDAQPDPEEEEFIDESEEDLGEDLGDEEFIDESDVDDADLEEEP